MSPYRFSQPSLNKLHTCDARLQEVALVALKITPMDFMVLEGYRSIEKQQEMFAKGRSKIDGTTRLGNHNHTPSRAMDLAPYPIDWDDRERFYFLGGLILAVGAMTGVRLRWGGDWDSDGTFKDQSFDDLPHFELTED